MADFPGAIYAPRVKNNAAGVEYDETKDTRLYAEDVVLLDDEVVAIETELMKAGFVFKKTSETVNNTIVLQNDDVLKFDYEANGVYYFRFFLRTYLRAASGFRGGFYAGAGCTLLGRRTGTVASAVALTFASEDLINVTSANYRVFEYDGVLYAGENGGTFGLKWAQNVAAAETTYVYQGSFLEYRKLA